MDVDKQKAIKEIKALSPEARDYLSEKLRNGLQVFLVDIGTKNIEAIKDDVQEMANILKGVGL